MLRRRCKTPGCPNLHTNRSGFCTECERKHHAQHVARAIATAGTRLEIPSSHRGSAWDRGYGSRDWREFAKGFLKRHPTCAICGAPATVCDHKDMPAQVMMDMYGRFLLDDRYYQPLCVSCNTRKAKEDQAKVEEYFKGRAFIGSEGPVGGDPVG